MATKLHKPVKRVSNELVRDAGKYRAIVVTIYPHGFIGLRPQGTRREETLPISHAYTIAIKARVAQERHEKAKARKAKKEGR